MTNIFSTERGGVRHGAFVAQSREVERYVEIPAERIAAAYQRGYDRAFTLRKSGDYLSIDADGFAGELYPGPVEMQNACARGLRAGWAASATEAASGGAK